MTRPEDHRLVDLLYGELTEEEERAYRRELDADPEQRREAEAMSDVLQAVRAVEDEEPSSHLDALILARARDEATGLAAARSEAGPIGWVRRFFRLPVSAIAAAGVAILATLFILPLAQKAVVGPAALDQAEPIVAPEVATLEAPTTEPTELGEETLRRTVTDEKAGSLAQRPMSPAYREQPKAGGKGDAIGGRDFDRDAFAAKAETPAVGASRKAKDARASRGTKRRAKTRRARAAPVRAGQVAKATAPPAPPPKPETRLAKKKSSASKTALAYGTQAGPTGAAAPADAPAATAPTADDVSVAESMAVEGRTTAPPEEDDGLRSDRSRRPREQAPSKKPAPAKEVARAEMEAPEPSVAQSAPAVSADLEEKSGDLAEDGAERRAQELAASFIRAAEAELVREDVDAARRILRRGQTRTKGTPAFGTVTLRLAQLELAQRRFAEAVRLAEIAARVPGFQQRAQARALMTRARIALERGHSQESEGTAPARAR